MKDARARIEDFLCDYVHMIDDDRLEEWPEYFTPDGIYQITTQENYQAGLPIGILSCEGQGMMSDRVWAAREANIYEPHRYCHLLGRPRIDPEGSGGYRVRANFTVVRTMQNGDAGIFVSGKYLDLIVFEDDAPKLKERRVILDSRRVDILIVYPI
jgi:3-phenylpropionate/cinnamic acid dioxygenase small subunit